MSPLQTIFLAILAASTSRCEAFAPATYALQQHPISEDATTTRLEATSSRRDWGKHALTWSTALLLPQVSLAEDVITPIDMKLFVDPKGLFSIIVPSSFFKIRRTEKGDLPDEKTGKGRRGSSIFTAGDLGKAEVIAVER